MALADVAGVDWAGGEWVIVRFHEGSYHGCTVVADFQMLWQRHQDLDRILIDVPIGLPDENSLGQREALDSLARTVTGFPSSVFPVPSREAAALAYEGESYETVAQQNERDIDKGLTQQSFQLAIATGQVDAVLGKETEATEKVIESHPEVCFRGLLGRQLRHTKSTAPGVGERLQALKLHLDQPGAVLQQVTTDLIGETGLVHIDDVLDALALAVVAQSGSEIKYLPSDYGRDNAEIPMRMAYWSNQRLPMDVDR